MTVRSTVIITCLAACDLGPRVDDPMVTADAPNPPDGPKRVLPAGTVIPSTSANAELLLQIKVNDGLVDAALMASGGVVTRSTGKAGGATVRFWNFGPAPVEGTFSVLAPLYVFGTLDGDVFTPLPDHPPLIDTIPGDIRYSPIRRVINVPVTETYDGELITSIAALDEAVQLGLVDEPANAGTWVNLPVVLPGTTLEVADAPAPPLAATQVFGRGYRVDVFELGTSLGRQPLRFGGVPLGQASLLLSGVPSGSPPTLPTQPDPQPVFQFAIPATPPGAMPNYTPLATEVSVRLASSVAPSAIAKDADLFTRSGAGAITGYYTDTVSSYTIGTTTNNMQLQFAEGSP